MEPIILELSNTIQEMKNEIQQFKNFKYIKTSSTFDLSIKKPSVCKKLLDTIAEKMDMNVIHRSNYHPTMSLTFKDNKEKVYQWSIHILVEDAIFFLQVNYFSPEHGSLNCNASMESIGDFELNGKSMDEIIAFIYSLQNKTKTVNCYYCGEINIHH
jgi:hypothetical protein